MDNRTNIVELDWLVSEIDFTEKQVRENQKKNLNFSYLLQLVTIMYMKRKKTLIGRLVSGWGYYF